jgi:tetratricopeptide (TPR) repeat protein/S1-C subfamily serine protease
MKTSILAAAFFLTTNLLSATPSRSSVTQRGEKCSRSRDSRTNRQLINQKVSKIAVRIVSSDKDNLGSGVLIGSKKTTSGTTYLVLTNQHVIRGKEVSIQTNDGKQYLAKPPDNVPSSNSKLKYDIALLEFNSPQFEYQIANLKYDSRHPLIRCRPIYSAGFPYDADKISIVPGHISQIPPTIPFDNGTQIPYITDREKDIKAGMSGGPIFVNDNNDVIVIGINATGAGAADPNYTNNTVPVPPKMQEKYDKANWGIPIYNILTTIPKAILDRYNSLPKLQYQVIEGYVKKLSNDKFWEQTVRIDSKRDSKRDTENGSGVIIGREEDTKTKTKTYYVLTAKHVIATDKKYLDDIKVITSRQRIYPIEHTSIIKIPNLDLAILSFSLESDDLPYKTAPLGDYKPIEDAPVFVSGFPTPSSIDSPLYKLQINPGQIVSDENTLFRVGNSNSVLYTNITNPGMSGSPIFDPDGRVVGIHGEEQLFFGNSIGISIQSFISWAKSNKFKFLKLETNIPRVLNEEESRAVEKLTTQTIILKPEGEDSADSSIKWSQYGNQCLRTTNYKEAIKAFDRAIKLDDTKADIYIRRGDAKLFMKDPTAISDFDRAIKLGSKKPYTYIRRGEAKLILKENRGALEDFNEAIKLDSNNPYVYISRGQVKLILKDNREAIKDFDRAIKLDSSNPYAYISRGQVKLILKDKQGASKDFDRAIELKPQYFYAYLNRNGVKLLKENSSMIIPYFDKAIKRDRKNPYAYANRGQMKSALNNNKGAMLDFDRAIQLRPSYGAAYLHRGETKLLLGDKQGAISDLKSAMKLFEEQGRIKLYEETKQQLDKINQKMSIIN